MIPSLWSSVFSISAYVLDVCSWIDLFFWLSIRWTMSIRLILVSLLTRQSSVKNKGHLMKVWSNWIMHYNLCTSNQKQLHNISRAKLDLPVACLPSRWVQRCSRAWLCSWRELGFSVRTSWISSSLNSSSLASSAMLKLIIFYYFSPVIIRKITIV